MKSCEIVLSEVGEQSIIVEFSGLMTFLKLEITFVITPVCPAVCVVISCEMHRGFQAQSRQADH